MSGTACGYGDASGAVPGPVLVHADLGLHQAGRLLVGLPHHTGRQPHGLQLLDPPVAAAYSPVAASRHGAGRGRYLSRHLVMCRVASYHSTSGAMPGSKPGQDGIRNILVRQQMLCTGRRTIELHTSTTYAVNATRCVCVLWGWERTGGVGWGGVRQCIPVHCALLKLPSHCCVQLLGRLSIPTPGATRCIHELGCQRQNDKKFMLHASGGSDHRCNKRKI